MQRRTLMKQLGAAGTLALSPAACLSTLLKPSAPSSHIFLNQLGYRPSDVKAATVANLPVPDSSFHILAADTGKVVFQGTLLPPAQDAASGDATRQAIFSPLVSPGLYRLEVGGQQSDPFPVRHDAYKDALRLTMRSFYGQRCGCKVDLGGGYRHPACHADAAFHPSSGRSGKLSNSGGWHDAGDYGRYIVNSGITTGTLLWAWELYPDALGTLALALPQSTTPRLPDFLEEIRWNLSWMLSLQDSDGGVWHKQTSQSFCAFIMPQDDKLTSYVIGTGTAPFKSTAATADLAAVAAIAARCYAPFDPTFAGACLAAARKAHAWAVAHPSVIFSNPPSVSTGDYGDKTLADELLWASAELWRTTGDASYEKQFLDALTPALDHLTIAAPDWGNVGSLACWAYVLADRPGSPTVKDRIRSATADAAHALIAAGASNGYGNTLDLRDYGWGSNSVAANQSLLLLIADRFNHLPTAGTTALNNLHYLLGRNCHGVSWVTQLGSRPFLHPHHRPSAADGIPAPWPGLLSCGPNARPADDVARRLPSAPPMRMWVDDERAYSLNEVAINWNAPLVFLLAAAESMGLTE